VVLNAVIDLQRTLAVTVGAGSGVVNESALIAGVGFEQQRQTDRSSLPLQDANYAPSVGALDAWSGGPTYETPAT